MTLTWPGPLKDMHRRIDLRAGAEIVVPTAPAWQPLATRLRDLLRDRAGVDLPVVPGDQAPLDRLRDRHWVLLGSAVVNPALMALYRRQYAFVDDYYPGGEGYVLRTLHNPQNHGHSALLVGASAPEGAAAGLDHLDRILEENGPLLGYTSEARSATHDALRPRTTPEEFRERTRAAFRANTGRSPLEQAITLGLAHHLTGDADCARIFRETLFYYQALVRDQYQGEWCFEHMLFIYAWTWRLFYVWDLIEESDAFTDADRRRMTDLLWGLTHYVAGLSYFQGESPPPPEIRQNHWTFAALSMSFAAGYFQTYYGVEDFARQLEFCRAIFAGQADCYKPNDDGGGGGYCWLVPNHLLTYDLQRDDFRFLEGGHLRELADYAILITDNLGAPVVFGDVGAYPQRRRASNLIAETLCKAAWHYREGGYLWALDWMGGEPHHGGYYHALPRQVPDWMTGIRVAPLTAPMHAWVREHAPGGANIPLDKAFDKLSLRQGFAEDDLYLLLDGTSTFAHGHDDGNSIENLTWKGRMWLAETDYIWRRPRHHSSVVSICDGRSGDTPALAALEWAEEFDTIALARTCVPAGNSVDWTRDLLWVRNRFLLVADSLCLLADADYDLRCLWRTLGQVRLEGSALRVEQQGVHFRIASAADADHSLLTEEPRVPGQDPYAAYDYADGPVRIFQQRIARRGRPGEVEHYFNLMRAGAPEEVDAVRVERLAPGIARAQDSAGALIFGVAEEEIQLGPWRIAARAFALTSETITLLGAVRLQFGEVSFSSDAPVHLTASPGQGRGEIRVQTAARLCVRQVPGITIAGATGATGDLDIDLSPGAHPLAFAPAWIDPLQGIRPDGRTDGPPRRSRAALIIPTDEPGFRPVWEQSLDGPLRCLDTLGAAGNWGPAIAAGTDAGQVAVLDRDGRILSAASTGARVETVHLADLGDGTALLAGGRDCALTCFDPTATVRWKRVFDPSHHRDQIVNAVNAADLTGDGQPTILAATDGWLVWAFDPRGAELWQRQIEHHAARSLVVADVEGDGKQEILVGTEYYNANLLEADGRIRWRIRGGPGFTALALADLDGDDVLEAVYGSLDGRVYAVDALSGEIRWTADLGDEVRHAAILHDSGSTSVVAGSDSGNVTLLTADGRRRWRWDLDAPVTGLALVPGRDGPQIAAVTADGRLVRFSADGQVLGSAHLSPGIAVLRPFGQGLLAGTGDGRLLHLVPGDG